MMTMMNNHVLLDSCRISFRTRHQPSKEWYRLKPLDVTKSDLELYAKSKKYILSNYEKIPKALRLRLLNICPACLFLSCFCKNNNKLNKANKGTMTCAKCDTHFRPVPDGFEKLLKQLSPDSIESNCKLCRARMLKIFSNYLTNVTAKSKTIRLMENRISTIDDFKYRLRVVDSNILLPPPFLWNDNIPLITRLLKLINNPHSYVPYTLKHASRPSSNTKYVKYVKHKLRLETVPDPLTFIGQGKRNCFRKLLLSKRSFNTARSVVVPAPYLQSNHMVMNRSIWVSMGQPRAVVAVRYPVLDLRSLTFHKIVGLCEEPVIAVPPTITCGSNMDYDGDSLNLYSLTRRMALEECQSIIDPESQFIVMSDLRVNFTHDELQTLISIFGVTKQQVYKWLYDTCVLTDSPNAFYKFESLRKSLWRVNEIFKPSVSYEFFKQLLTHFPIQSPADEGEEVENNEEVRKETDRDFGRRWDLQEFTRDCVFSDYIKLGSWKLDHVQKMVKLVRGLNKIEYIREAFACRLSLSKSEVEYTGYTTNKMSYSMPELWYSKDGTVCYGDRNKTPKMAYPDLRRLYSPTVSYSVLYKFAVYRVLAKLFK